MARITAEWADGCNVRLSKRLESMSDNIISQCEDELKKAAEEVQTEAKSKAPIKTGALRESIKKKFYRNLVSNMAARVWADYPETDKVRMSTTKKQKKGSRVYYAFAMEFGTKHNRAFPFMKPAAATVDDEMAGRIERIINREADRV